MTAKDTALDFAVKAANMCRFLTEEKNERLISQKLFDASSDLASHVYCFSDPSLSKAELSALKKEAALCVQSVTLYLDMLSASGFISAAQHQSVLKTLTSLKKDATI